MANARLAQAGRRVAATLDAALERRERPSLDERMASLRALRAERRVASAARMRVGLLGAAALAAASAGLYLVSRPSDLTFSVEGARGEVGAWIAAPDRDVSLRFSDGTRIDLRPSSRTRVIDAGERGASILLEQGSLSAHVVHRERSAWTVTAGPFAVHVVGTRFEAAWDPSSEVLRVALSEGRVEVTGACLRDPRPVVTGESVRLTCRDVVTSSTPRAAGGLSAPSAPNPASTLDAPGALSTPSAPDAGGVPPADTTTPADSPASSDGNALTAPRDSRSPASSDVSAPPASSEAASQPRPAPSWRALAKKGDYAAAFGAADREGIDAIATQGSSAELLELADIARLTKHPAIAQRLYATARTRYPGSDPAAAAAFHLGRMRFDTDAAEAQQWFSTYLAERPAGAFAAEALGRLLEVQHQTGQADAARATAARYLAAYPKGAHAGLARSLLAP